MIILDIDNCISDDTWRLPLIDRSPALSNFDQFHPYHLRAPEDRAANIEHFKFCPNILIFTSRPWFYRRQTLDWLRKNGVQPYQMFMREDDDARGGVYVKRDFLKIVMARGDVIHSAYDDRDDIIMMYSQYIGDRAIKLAINEQQHLYRGN